MEISAVEPRRKGLSALFLDGEFAMNVDTETLLRARLKPGMDITDEELHSLLTDGNTRRAQEKALYLLEHRNHSKKELAQKLARTTGREAAQEAAERMEELGLVDDERFARGYAETLFGRKGFAARRAEYELLQKGIDRELARSLIDELAPEPEEKLAELLDRKYASSLSDEKGVRRTIAALQRLGYEMDDIRTALRRLEESE